MSRAENSGRQDLGEQVSALVRAIRRVMRHPKEGDNLNGGVVMFRVEDVFAFARRLVELPGYVWLETRGKVLHVSESAV